MVLAGSGGTKLKPTIRLVFGGIVSCISIDSEWVECRKTSKTSTRQVFAPRFRSVFGARDQLFHLHPFRRCFRYIQLHLASMSAEIPTNDQQYPLNHRIWTRIERKWTSHAIHFWNFPATCWTLSPPRKMMEIDFRHEIRLEWSNTRAVV